MDRVARQQLRHAVGMFLELFQWQWRHRVVFGDVMPDELQETVPLRRSLRDIVLRRAKTLLNHVAGDAERDWLHTLNTPGLRGFVGSTPDVQPHYWMQQRCGRDLFPTAAPSLRHRDARSDRRQNR